MPNSALPEHLKNTKHWDYPKPLQWIPRAWTSFDWGKPKKLVGNQKRERSGAPAPIGEAGSWQLSVFPGAPWYMKPFAWYFAWSGKEKNGKIWHLRFGARYDDVDDYTNFPTAARRKYSAEGEMDTSTDK